MKRRTTSVVLLAGAIPLLLLQSACATREAGLIADASVKPLEAAFAPPRGPHLEVQLSFAAEVDLDLYVSDPLLETTYYANTPSRTGGTLLRDQRCEERPASAPRVERVDFPYPRAGRYRVGVDFPEACAGGGAAVFVLRIHAGGESRTVRGRLAPLEFRSRVIEFSVDATGKLLP